MKIHEVAELTGVTVRTLHHYDAIGLLKPETVTPSGYRNYSEEDLERLQQILFFRELGFPLDEIRRIMTHPGYDKSEALSRHRELLLIKKQRLDELIALVDKTLAQQQRGEKTMEFKAFDATRFETAKAQYAEEVKNRWGDTQAYAESEAKTAQYSGDQWNAANDEAQAIFAAFAAARQLGAESPEVQALVARWQAHITKHYYTCTKEILSGLGMMYVADERFKQNLDSHGEGTAQLMSDAIAAYCK